MPADRPAWAGYNKRFGEYLETSSGSIDGAADYSSTAGSSTGSRDLSLTPSSGTRYDVYGLVAYIAGSSGFPAAKYGDVSSTGIVNGVSISVKSTSETLYTITSTDNTIDTNGDWASVAGDGWRINTNGSTGVTVDAVAHLHFDGAPVTLQGDNGEYLAVTLADDFSGLVTHSFYAYGMSSVRQ